MTEQKTSLPKQTKFFGASLENQLNQEHQLYKLKNMIDWKSLESNILQNLDFNIPNELLKNLKLILGIFLLQIIENTSDAYAVEAIQENSYWQYFCGYEHIQKKIKISEENLIFFHILLGEETHQEIRKELLKLGINLKKKKKRFALSEYSLEY